ncbi:MAG TPA: MBL fold metallo-hydrolase [Ignavibacteriaceae bacterium]|jgi:L-ascorbate metabolism protein UlaG (beta-lactamase superfamily)|nr:MBL fold metallo-hydrolase [Ignavibacteriaceae bacterium]
MKTNYKELLIGLLFAVIHTAYSQNTNGLCAITYIANEGFLVETTNHKVIVDALFGNIKGDWCEQPSDSILHAMISGMLPFNGIDAIMVSHYHVDHFDQQMVTDFMKNHTETILVCPNQVDEILHKNVDYPIISSRIRRVKSAIPHDTLIVVNGIEINSMRINHGSYIETDTASGESVDRHRNVENLSFLINVDGYTLSHSGDASSRTPSDFFKNYELDKQEIHIALFDRSYLRPDALEIVNEVFKPKNIILMHISPSGIDMHKNFIKNDPRMFIFFKPMEVMRFQ